MMPDMLDAAPLRIRQNTDSLFTRLRAFFIYAAYLPMPLRCCRAMIACHATVYIFRATCLAAAMFADTPLIVVDIAAADMRAQQAARMLCMARYSTCACAQQLF